MVLLFIPEVIRGCRVGTALVAAAEAEARARGCGGSHVDAFNFQAAGFYRRLGYTQFGALAGYPPGYKRLYFQKHFAASSVLQGAG